MERRCWLRRHWLAALVLVLLCALALKGYWSRTLGRSDEAVAAYLTEKYEGSVYDDSIRLLKTAERDGWLAALYRRSWDGGTEGCVAVFRCRPLGRCTYDGMELFRDEELHMTGAWRKGGSRCHVVVYGDNRGGRTAGYSVRADGEALGREGLEADYILDIYRLDGAREMPDRDTLACFCYWVV